MNLERERKEIFALMLKEQRCDDLNEIVAIQMEIQRRLEPLINLTGLSLPALEAILERQFAHWLRSMETEQGAS